MSFYFEYSKENFVLTFLKKPTHLYMYVFVFELVIYHILYSEYASESFFQFDSRETFMPVHIKFRTMYISHICIHSE